MNCALFDIYADARATTAHSAGLPHRFRVATVDHKRKADTLKQFAGRRPVAVPAGDRDALADGGVYA